MKKDVESLGNYGAVLSLIEVGFGSLLHSLHVPFAGVFLSLNQGYLLCRVSIKTKDRWIAYNVSNIAAVLKSLAPAGSKLGPMLSLSMQGLLFNLGTLFGINPFGLAIGMILLSIWSFVQPLVTYYIFFGDKLLGAIEYWYEKTLPYHHLESGVVLKILAGAVILKMIAAFLLSQLAWKKQGEDRFQNKLIDLAKPKRAQTGSPLKLALKDMTRPLFLISLILTSLFLFFSQHRWSEVIAYLLRPVAIGFLFFYFSRTLTLDRWLMRLHGGKLDSFAKGCVIALEKVRKVI
jgi:hypothetical protein